MMIWDYDNPAVFQTIVDLFVFTSNFVAVRVWTGSGIASALAISLVIPSFALPAESSVVYYVCVEPDILIS